jgi:hypothetical protein
VVTVDEARFRRRTRAAAPRFKLSRRVRTTGVGWTCSTFVMAKSLNTAQTHHGEGCIGRLYAADGGTVSANRTDVSVEMPPWASACGPGGPELTACFG